MPSKRTGRLEFACGSFDAEKQLSLVQVSLSQMLIEQQLVWRQELCYGPPGSISPKEFGLYGEVCSVLKPSQQIYITRIVNGSVSIALVARTR